MKEQIKDKLENKLFGLRAYMGDNKITPQLLCNLNGASELAVRLDQIEKIISIIDESINYIYDNRTNKLFTNGKIEALKDLKSEIQDGIKKR